VQIKLVKVMKKLQVQKNLELFQKQMVLIQIQLLVKLVTLQNQKAHVLRVQMELFQKDNLMELAHVNHQ
jgi:hypothetical protein